MPQSRTILRYKASTIKGQAMKYFSADSLSGNMKRLTDEIIEDAGTCIEAFRTITVSAKK